MTKRIPFFWSKGKLFLHTLLWTGVWVLASILVTASNVPDSAVCSLPFFSIALLYATIWVVKVAKDQNTAIENRAARERYLAQQQSRTSRGLVDIYDHPATTRLGEKPQKSSEGVHILKVYNPPTRSDQQ